MICNVIAHNKTKIQPQKEKILFGYLYYYLWKGIGGINFANLKVKSFKIPNGRRSVWNVLIADTLYARAARFRNFKFTRKLALQWIRPSVAQLGGTFLEYRITNMCKKYWVFVMHISQTSNTFEDCLEVYLWGLFFDRLQQSLGFTRGTWTTCIECTLYLSNSTEVY